nr:restriction endonuclease subunit S [Bradyrhizobium sp. 17]
MRTARLDDICEINPGMPKSLDDSEIGSFLSMAAVSEGGRINFEEERPVAAVKKGYTYFERGDVLLAKITPCFENGKATRTAALGRPFGFGSTEFHVLRAANEVLPDYLFYRIWNSSFREFAAKNMTGSAGQKRVPVDFLRRLEIPLPPLGEQRRIAAILDKADALRRKRKRTIELLDSLTQSIFRRSFVERHSSKWPVHSVESVALDARTGPFGSQLLRSEFVDQGISVLGIDNVVTNEFRWGERRYISEEKYAQLHRYTVSPGDVLITIMGTCGRCAIVPDDIPIAINTKHLCCITLDKEKCLPEFLQATFLQHPDVLQQLGVQAKGAVMPGLNMRIIKSLTISLPPINLQMTFVKEILSLKAMLMSSRIAETTTASLFSSLQSRGFSNQL